MSSTSKILKLPYTDDDDITSRRHEVNPAIALKTLTNIYQKVQQFQAQLRQLTQKIHLVYAEGPIVSGWLASEASLNAAVKYSSRPSVHSASVHPPVHPIDGPVEPQVTTSPQPAQDLGTVDVALFRHGDTNDLMNYLSALESAVLDNRPAANHVANHAAPRPLSTAGAVEPRAQQPQASLAADHAGSSSQYYLCRLTSCGQIQTEQCPPEQVPVLSMAIARYRRLNQLIKQKQIIETKLQAIVDILGDIETVLAD